MTRNTASQPSAPPARPSPQELARLRAENEALTVQLTNEALRGSVQAGQPATEGPPVGVIRDPDGRIVVTGRDGRQVVIDPKAVADEDAVQELVQTALEPPRVPEPPGRGRSGEDVAIVSIVFPCLIAIMLIVWRIVATSKRPGSAAAAAGVPDELAARLSRIEQAIEAVAIEVERIAESERYSARLLTERLPALQPARAAAAAPAQAGRAETPTADVQR